MTYLLFSFEFLSYKFIIIHFFPVALFSFFFFMLISQVSYNLKKGKVSICGVCLVKHGFKGGSERHKGSRGTPCGFRAGQQYKTDETDSPATLFH